MDPLKTMRSPGSPEVRQEALGEHPGHEPEARGPEISALRDERVEADLPEGSLYWYIGNVVPLSLLWPVDLRYSALQPTRNTTFS